MEGFDETKMSKKKSGGIYGLSQDKLITSRDILKIPLTQIINESIESGEFPETWKEALITPILKKEDKARKENYRPVRSLPVASKVLEKITSAVNRLQSSWKRMICFQKINMVFSKK
jgi:hypothetical protein